MSSFWKSTINNCIANLKRAKRILQSDTLTKWKRKEIETYIKDTIKIMNWVCEDSKKDLRQTMKKAGLQELYSTYKPV